MVRPPKSSRFRGVSWHKRHRKWSVSIYLRSRRSGKLKQQFVGLFEDELDAARAYNDAAEEYGGVGPLNEIPDDPPPPSEAEIAERAAAIRARRFAGQTWEAECA